MPPEQKGKPEEDKPIPGKVLYLDDPYCWYSHADVRPFMGSPEYAVRITREEPRDPS